jgi:hypothetical protein
MRGNPKSRMAVCLFNMYVPVGLGLPWVFCNSFQAAWECLSAFDFG